MDEWLQVRGPNADDIQCTVVGEGGMAMYNRPLTPEEIPLLDGMGIDVVGVWDRALTREEIEAAKRGEPVPGNRLTEVYLLQNSWSGNVPLWWKEGGAGYTLDVTKAHRFTYEEAKAQHLTRRADVPWPVEVVEKGLVTAFYPEKVPKEDRAKARDLRERMVTEGRGDGGS